MLSLVRLEINSIHRTTNECLRDAFQPEHFFFVSPEVNLINLMSRHSGTLIHIIPIIYE